jgi:hypothetical protein
MRGYMPDASKTVLIAVNRTFHKGQSKERIDGAMATWMTVARTSAGESSTSVYDSQELRFV